MKIFIKWEIEKFLQPFEYNLMDADLRAVLMCLGEQVARLVYSLEMDRSHVSCITTCYRDTLYSAYNWYLYLTWHQAVVSSVVSTTATLILTISCDL